MKKKNKKLSRFRTFWRIPERLSQQQLYAQEEKPHHGHADEEIKQLIWSGSAMRILGMRN